jgi:hypothetical protein
VQAAALRLVERDLHDLLGDALDLDVHLQRGDAVRRARDLKGDILTGEFYILVEMRQENSL